MNARPDSNAKWLCDSPVNSDVEAKLRHLLVELGNADRIFGIQVCAYKDGQVIIDTAAGVLGKDDPRPVQHDTLFPVFSATKGLTAGMIHWLADKGKLKLDENVADIWPEFGTNGKDQIKVYHILAHTSGLHDALAGISEDLTLFCDWDECLKRIAMVAPETEPGRQQFYHYLSYGWLCGGIIEHASGKKFQEILEEAFVRPLNVEGELYIGVPPGVESRLATVTLDTSERRFFRSNIIPNLINSSNSLHVRRAVLPAANGHVTARALARYYATLVDGGVIPPSHSAYSLPPLGSHPHHPMFLSKETSKNHKNWSKKDSDGSNSSSEGHTTNPKSNLHTKIPESDDAKDEVVTKIFNKPKAKVLDAFMGSGDYEDFVIPNGIFGLGFMTYRTIDGLVVGFGHAGVGGSTGYCDVNNRFAIAVTLNKLSFSDLTREIIRFVCSELNLPVPNDYADSRNFTVKPAIN